MPAPCFGINCHSDQYRNMGKSGMVSEYWAQMDSAGRRNLVGFTALFILMAVTRFHHFGTISTPPDASLAVFFLAGLYLTNRWVSPALLLEAVAVDMLATTCGGVSGWCITPAYVFLIPTYGVMWLGGFWCRRYTSVTTLNTLGFGGVLLFSISTAFIVSNVSFFYLSGYFAEGVLATYLSGISNYYLPYTVPALVYAYCGLAIFNLLQKRLPGLTPAQ